MCIVFQQDSAPCHCATDARDYLDDIFGNNWCGRGGPIMWPPNSPDLTPPDFFFWGFVKNDVNAQRPRDINDLRAKIFSAFEEHTPEMLDHKWYDSGQNDGNGSDDIGGISSDDGNDMNCNDDDNESNAETDQEDKKKWAGSLAKKKVSTEGCTGRNGEWEKNSV
ncbi:hypothetical protein ANN_11368 [Periplaneta americana]|uniref:Uncharacterized protein n=1 Tax=Periplaneta americana TaxID=6978 RepID=A0ABQ8T6I6_PERAM|nr:hypothetical protein ANN_11368 [Periplaneta americana]